MDNTSTAETEKKPPEAFVWEDRLEAKMKHLEMIQSVITRITNNSFMIKGWCITLVSALLAFAVGKDGNPWLAVVAFPAVLVFWYLDGFFFRQEKLFRQFYNQQIALRNTDFQITPSNDLSSGLESVSVFMWNRAILRPFYGRIFIIVLITISILITLKATHAQQTQKHSDSLLPATSPAITIPKPSPSQDINATSETPRNRR